MNQALSPAPKPVEGGAAAVRGLVRRFDGERERAGEADGRARSAGGMAMDVMWTRGLVRFFLSSML
jgi:hypothetical protein